MTDVSKELLPEEMFLTAYVSKDTRVIGIEHDTEAEWDAVLQAHVALRDRLNVRIAEQSKCPFYVESAPADVDTFASSLGQSHIRARASGDEK